MASKYVVFDDDNPKVEYGDLSSPRLSQGLRKSIKRIKFGESRKAKSSTDTASTGLNKYANIKRAMLSAVSDDQERASLEDLLRNLEGVTKDLLRQNEMSADESTVGSGVVSLLKTFIHYTDSFNDKHANRLLTHFGPFSPIAAKRAHDIVNRIRHTLPAYDRNGGGGKTPADVRQDLKSIMKYYGGALAELDNEEDECRDGHSHDDNDCFGQSVKFANVQHDALWIYDDTVKPTIAKVLNCFKPPGNDLASGLLSFKIADILERQKSANAATATNGDVASSSMQQQDFDIGTLISRLSDYSENVQDICRSLMALLDSNKTDDMLQGELMDLLGFDHFDLIMNIFQNRTKIVQEYNQLVASSAAKDKLQFIKAARKAGGPNYGQTITVASERELSLAKELRKEDKRLRKLQDKRAQTSYNDIIDVDVARKIELEREFETAQNMPLFFKPELSEIPNYPYVFDSSLTLKRTASIIAGNKILLPENVKQVDNKMYHEYSFEPTPPPPTDIGKNRIQIADLDETAKIAFRNTTQLNQIQTVVFEKAYKTNENLLICAPTGAGKTNIAMLCILKVVRDYMSPQGVLRKNDFKIVYVAPMKALAAEMVRNFGQRLLPFGISVKELTGDMQLTKHEIMQTQMLITTPEKWDVVTRKTTGDVALSQMVRLIILDEVHLLHDDRGPVIETLVARTKRQIEVQQTMIRIVGLSATLPNYVDVAQFMQVNLHNGLFFFDGRFRPVPLGQSFIGVKAPDFMTQMEHMDQICYEKALDFVRRGHQVMVFVHARNATGRVASSLKELANNKGHTSFFAPENSPAYGLAQKAVSKSRNKQLQELFPSGFGIHHAGMLRADRNLVERLFSEGHLKVLCCTATLAWGVNLPAHAVIIRGTDIYDSKRSSFIDLGILDVQQIFGRAGRPQFDTHGYGIIITTYPKLSHYLSLLTRQAPIESQLANHLVDNLNAEIVLGTVATMDEAIEWLSYTYYYVRLRKNPLAYGVNYQQFMVINSEMKDIMTDDTILAVLSDASEFRDLKVRDDELDELEELYSGTRLKAIGGCENTQGKVNILLQTHISRMQIDGFSLISDSAYVIQNASRILRALFEMQLRKNNSFLSAAILKLSKALEQRVWPDEHPFKQFFSWLKYETVDKVIRNKLSVQKLREMNAEEITQITRCPGQEIKAFAYKLPCLNIVSTVMPITRHVLRVRLNIEPEFNWDERVHGRGSELFHIWIEDPESNFMYYREEFMLSRKQVVKKEIQELVFTVPITDPIPSQYLVRWISDRWLGSESTHTLLLGNLILPDRFPSHTELLDLQPLPITALSNDEYEKVFKFTHFNAVQTQIFYCLYHTDHNALVGAPTGSGKTVAAELAILRMFKESPGSKVVYIAPMKALVRERMKDWKERFERLLGKKVVELTGDVTPDIQTLSNAHIVVTTPEKWDGISRSWQNRSYVRNVALIIIDEIHLLGEDRGPVLEVIVSRTNFISGTTTRKVRIIGLSTALANANDLADWLNIKQMGLYNFKPSVRPVPLEVHISGYPEKHYCPRMASMNKPVFQAIKTHSPKKPVLIFVSSRRQTRLTSLDLIAYLASGSDPKQWLHIDSENSGEVVQNNQLISMVKDHNLKLTLEFGIGLHHAGLQENDRKIVEELFVNQKIQVLVATATLAWGVNFPAHLVVIKGTEYYDGKTRRYVDFPVTDVLQMMGRAGRPQFDDSGIAVILVHDVKKHFYKKFLYDPFPVESSLLNVLCDHLNAEIIAGTISTKQQAMDYLTWTYFFRRVLVNPSYYHLPDSDQLTVNKFLTEIIDRSLMDLQASYCVEIGEDNRALVPQNLGRIASFYYLSHKTMRIFRERISEASTGDDLLKILTSVPEYDEIPVRHNEDIINSELAKSCPLPVDPHTFDDPHTKAHLLFQSYFSRIRLPSSDFETDLKSVLDQSIRILQAMLDVSAEQGWLAVAIRITQLIQMVVQARWVYDSPLSILPHVEFVDQVRHFKVSSLPELQVACNQDRDYLMQNLKGIFGPSEVEDILKVLNQLPKIDIRIKINGWWPGAVRVQTASITLKETNVRDAKYIAVHADQEYVLCIDLERLNKKNDARAYAPKFPKTKDEGWFVVLGDVEKQELLALKRIGPIRGRSSTNLCFATPGRVGRLIYTVYLLSDSYLGLDYQYDIYMDVLPASIECQVNAEVLTEDR